MSLAGRTAVVTGGSSGIGRATAERLAGLGASVTALARRTDPIPGVRVAALDVTDADAALAAFAELERLDVLVAAAGTNVPARRLDEPTPAAWDEVVDTNL